MEKVISLVNAMNDVGTYLGYNLANIVLYFLLDHEAHLQLYQVFRGLSWALKQDVANIETLHDLSDMKVIYSLLMLVPCHAEMKDLASPNLNDVMPPLKAIYLILGTDSCCAMTNDVMEPLKVICFLLKNGASCQAAT
jgi:hypothetical protein